MLLPLILSIVCNGARQKSSIPLFLYIIKFLYFLLLLLFTASNLTKLNWVMWSTLAVRSIKRQILVLQALITSSLSFSSVFFSKNDINVSATPRFLSQINFTNLFGFVYMKSCKSLALDATSALILALHSPAAI